MASRDPDDELELSEHVASLQALVRRIRLLLVQRSGAMQRERVAGAQLGLFCEVATLAETPAQTEAQSVEVPAHRRSRDKRAPLPAELPRVDIVHELSEAERLCPHDGEWLEAFAEETSEQLDIVPAKVQVLRHRRVKYRCACCEGHVVTAPLPAQPTPTSLASPG